MTERLKGLHDRICIRANMAGELDVGVETEFVFMNSFWKDLEAPALDGKPPPPRDPSQKASVVVDAGLLGRVLNSSHLRPNVTILCEHRLLDSPAHACICLMTFRLVTFRFGFLCLCMFSAFKAEACVHRHG